MHLREVVRALKRGEPVIFPTDTVYGIGVSAWSTEGIRKIRRLKKRSTKKPLVWLIDSPHAAKVYAKGISREAQRLMKRFWPGALTLIFRASMKTRSRQKTIGLRVPRHPLVRKLIRLAGAPLATTSVNASGKKSAVSCAQMKSFIGKIPYILDSGRQGRDMPSTIVDVAGGAPRIIRIGAIPRELI